MAEEIVTMKTTTEAPLDRRLLVGLTIPADTIMQVATVEMFDVAPYRRPRKARR